MGSNDPVDVKDCQDCQDEQENGVEDGDGPRVVADGSSVDSRQRSATGDEGECTATQEEPAASQDKTEASQDELAASQDDPEASQDKPATSQDEPPAAQDDQAAAQGEPARASQDKPAASDDEEKPPPYESLEPLPPVHPGIRLSLGNSVVGLRRIARIDPPLILHLQHRQLNELGPAPSTPQVLRHKFSLERALATRTRVSPPPGSRSRVPGLLALRPPVSGPPVSRPPVPLPQLSVVEEESESSGTDDTIRVPCILRVVNVDEESERFVDPRDVERRPSPEIDSSLSPVQRYRQPESGHASESTDGNSRNLARQNVSGHLLLAQDQLPAKERPCRVVEGSTDQHG